MPDSRVLRLRREFERRAVPLLRKSVLPLFAANPTAESRVGELSIIEASPISGVATCTLMEHKGLHFIVTAEHVISDWKKAGMQLRIGVGNPQRPLPLELRNDEVAADPSLDIAVIRLRPGAAGFIFDPGFVTKQHIEFVDSLDDANYLLPGYLWKGSQPNSDRTAFLLQNSNIWLRRCDAKINANGFGSPAFGWLESNCDWWCIPDGELSQLPVAMGGMSGASVWRVFRPDQSETGLNLDTLRIVAVQNRVYGDEPGTVSRCTLWKHVIPLVEHLI